MTYAEATRQAEEDARWIRNAKLELDKRAERLAKCQAIISAALTVEVVQEPVAAVFVHPDDEPEMPHQNGMFYEPQPNGRIEGADLNGAA